MYSEFGTSGLLATAKIPAPLFAVSGYIYSIHTEPPSSRFKPFNIVARIIYRVDIQNRFTGLVAGSKSIILYLMLCGHACTRAGLYKHKKTARHTRAGLFNAMRFVRCSDIHILCKAPYMHLLSFYDIPLVNYN